MLHSHALGRIGWRGGKGRCDRGVGVHRRGAAAARRGPPRARRGAWPPATRRPARPSPSCTRASRPPTATWPSSACDPTAVDGLDLVFLGLPHGASQALVPELRRPGGPHRRPGRRLPAARRRRCTRQWYGEAHTAPELLADFAYGLPELFRDEIAARRARRRARLLPDRGGAGARAAACGPGWSSRPASSSTPPVGRVGRRAAAEAQHHVLHGRRGLHRLRPARPTATPPRWSRCIGAQVLFTPAPRADEPGHPRHLLRPARRGAHDHRRRCSTLLRAAYAGEPFVVVRRRARRRPRRPRLEHAPTSPPASTSAPAGSSPSRALDNLVKGASGQAVQCANLAPRPPRDHRPPDRRACTRERHRGRRASSPPASPAASRRRATPTCRLVATADGAAGRRRRPCSPPTR